MKTKTMPDVPEAARIMSRLSVIARRLCDVETWSRIAQDLIEHGGGDIVKLEERVEEQQLALDKQAERLARLELQCGIALARRDVDA